MLLSWFAAVVTAYNNEQLIKCLANLITSWPSDEDWFETSTSWNLRRNWTRPVVSVLPTSAEDVSDAIKCARQQDMKCIAKSGGHSYESYGSYGDPESGSVQIDTRYLNEIRYKYDSNVAHIGPATRLGKLYYTLYKNNFHWFPPGLCPTLAVAGFTLGGGVGFWSRYWGMASDHIISITGVLANGTIVDIDDNENPDLFWALRGGGGGNFAIITDFEIRTELAPENVTVSISSWPINNASEITYKVLRTAATGSEEMGWELILYKNRVDLWITLLPSRDGSDNSNEIPDLLKLLPEPNERTQKEMDLLSAYLNVSDRLGITSTVEDLNFPRNYVNHQKKYAKKKSLMIRRNYTDLNRETCDYLQEIMASASSDVFIAFELYGGQIQSLKPEDTAFVHRDTEIILSGVHIADTPIDRESEIWLERWWENMRIGIGDEPYHSYQNYVDQDLGEDWARAYYGTNLARMKEVQKIYDPDRVFTGPQAIASIAPDREIW